MNIILNQLEIETCSLCNRKCPWCLFGQIPDFRGNELQFLEIRYIEKIFRELNRNHFKGIINFYSMNEPLLDKRITDTYYLYSYRNCEYLSGKKMEKVHDYWWQHYGGRDLQCAGIMGNRS